MSLQPIQVNQNTSQPVKVVNAKTGEYLYVVLNAKPNNTEAVVRQADSYQPTTAIISKPIDRLPSSQESLNQEALENFSACKTKSDFIDLAKKLEVEVYDADAVDKDGNKQSWVNNALSQMNSLAFVYTPYSKRYGEKIEQANPSESPNLYDDALDKLDKQAKQGLFISSNASPDVLMHELFHVLQEKNGLPFGVSPEVDQKVETFCDGLRKPSIKGAIVLMTLLAKAAILNTTRTKLEVDERTPFALSFLRHHQREIEANQFVINHGKQLGLTESTIGKHKLHLLQNKLMQFIAPAIAVSLPNS